MPTKTIRSRFNHEVGGFVEGFKIISKTVVMAPVPAEKRLGVYDYEVEVPVTVVPAKCNRSSSSAPATTKRAATPSTGGTRREVGDSFVTRRLGTR